VFCQLWKHREPNLNETYAANYATYISPLKAHASFVDNATTTISSKDGVDYSAVNSMAYRPYRRSGASSSSSAVTVSKEPPATGGVYATRFDLTVTYPCPAPFCDPSSTPSSRPLPLVNTIATITLPSHITLASDQKPGISVGVFMAGTTVTVSWHAYVNDTVAKSSAQQSGDARVHFAVSGWVSNTMPRTIKSPTETYPSYTYSDEIGVTFDIRAP
jgi:hypothetical protein